MLDINKMKGNKILEKDIDIQALMQAENAGDACSVQNIQISNTVAFIGDKDTGVVDDDYNPGF